MIDHDDKKRAIPSFDSNTYWQSKKFEYDVNNNITYIGKHKSQDADTSSTDWYITKFTWSFGQLTDIELLMGSWDNRATLTWN